MNRKPPLVALVAGIAVAGWALGRALAPKMSFAGKVVLITGGSRGLGLVLARQVCAAGGRVVLLARDQDELQRAHDELSRAGGDVSIIACDLLDRAQIEAAVRNVVAHYGGLDVLINNAGIIEVGPLEHMTREDFERAMQLHLWAPFTLMMEAIPHLRARGGGRIVNISSIGGKIAVPHLAPYCASKFALVGLSDSMRSELTRDRIYVTTVAPGMMRTGSHVNAQFKGRHADEFAWFATANAMPGLSMNVERAAAKILEACRRGQPALTLTLAAQAAVIGNAAFPNLTAHALNLTTRLLPTATDSSGDRLQSGRESRAARNPPRWLTYLADLAISRTNEQGTSPAK
ncbi:MAG: SDR family oxidoreductase [Verrucomicrobiota bacterium]|nr:SDR family oxidoreductase [Verrucomicrobiota bacterium]